VKLLQRNIHKNCQEKMENGHLCQKEAFAKRQKLTRKKIGSEIEQIKTEIFRKLFIIEEKGFKF
jgi:hypothetical protein